MQPEIVTFFGLQLPVLCCLAYWKDGVMSGVEWRSEEAYANFKQAEAVDIAWEWLRRDSEYQREYRSLASVGRSGGVTETFRRQWGLSFRS